MNSSVLKTLMLALIGGWGCTLATQAQTFTNGNGALPATYNSGGCVGFADLDGDSYDDLVILDQSHNFISF